MLNKTSCHVPVVSAELFIIPMETGEYIVYAPLRRAAFVANARVVNFLANLQEGFFDENADPDGYLVEFLRRLKILDAGSETLPLTIFSGNPEPTSVTLFLTTACNLRCTYCYASAGDTPTKVMSLDVAKRGIDFVAANALKRGEDAFTVTYHGGGEPTVNWRTMTESLAYAREKAAVLNVRAEAFAGSNGVLSDSQIDWMIANLDGVSLSFDGLPEVHDTHRLTISGQGSSERVMHTMHRFDEVGFEYGLRVTVTSDQIHLLPESIEFICSRFHPTRIQVEPSYQIGRWQNAPSSETEEFITAFREAQQRAGRHDQEIFFSAARLGTLTNHFCGISQDGFSLSPDGNVSACYEVFSEQNTWAKTFFYGRPDQQSKGYKFNLPVLNNLRSQAVQHREYCKGCFAKWTCAGDCYHKSLTANGSEEFAGSDRCHITRELTKDQILARIANSGGVFWYEPPAPEASVQVAGKEI
ncbi:MAG: radical SAM protein [Acidobacteria bacterium]|nr:radical SAM protein [Acidobacteriota bacterium]